MPPTALALLRLYRAVLTLVSLAALVGGWYLISQDQQQQQIRREQMSRTKAIAPGP